MRVIGKGSAKPFEYLKQNGALQEVCGRAPEGFRLQARFLKFPIFLRPVLVLIEVSDLWLLSLPADLSDFVGVGVQIAASDLLMAALPANNRSERGTPARRAPAGLCRRRFLDHQGALDWDAVFGH